MTAAALAGAILQGPSGSDAIAGSQMSTGVTVTATTAPSGMPIPVAQPSIKGPAPLPPEEQGLPRLVGGDCLPRGYAVAQGPWRPEGDLTRLGPMVEEALGAAESGVGELLNG